MFGCGLGGLVECRYTRGVLPEPCTHRVRTVRPFAYSVSTRSTMPESEMPWLVAGLPDANRGCKVQKKGPWNL